jgi:hypothetical protein
MLRIIFVPKSERVIGGWRKLHEELHILYSLPNIIMLKSNRMRWVGYVACMREM